LSFTSIRRRSSGVAGEFTVAPAQVELMYSPDIRGHSGTFRLRVKDEPGVAVTVK
jgi:hypothetical protein